jgi:hypothetical protein
MNDWDPELFEAELRKLSPARPPAELMARLVEARPVHVDQTSKAPNGFGVRQSSAALAVGNVTLKRQTTGAVQSAVAPNHARGPTVPQPSTLNPQPLWWLLLRWLTPAAAVAALVAALLAWWPHGQGERQQAKAATATAKLGSRPDEVEIDQQLVGLFDAVAQLPSGQPVRFRCRQWSDEVVLRDPTGGLVVERRTPRLEVVPVRLEVY